MYITGIIVNFNASSIEFSCLSGTCLEGLLTCIQV